MRRPLPYVLLDCNIKIVPAEAPQGNLLSGGVGLAALAIGLVAITLHWLPLLGVGPEVLTFVFGSGSVATVVGAISGAGLLTKSSRLGRSVSGFYGMLLGLATLIMGTALYALGYLVLWG